MDSMKEMASSIIIGLITRVKNKKTRHKRDMILTIKVIHMGVEGDNTYIKKTI
jgi:hypothetical protein